MKKISLSGLFLLLCLFSISQPKLPPPDKSPMDMSYYPVNYPILKIQNKTSEPPFARIVYSRPYKNGRKVFGELVEYGKVWRLGANEATEIELFKDAVCAGNKIKKGRYSMYAIPNVDKWTIIFNKATDVWGAFQYDSTKDVLRFDLEPQKVPVDTEAFTMVFDSDSLDGNSSKVNLVIAWDDVKVDVPFSY